MFDGKATKDNPQSHYLPGIATENVACTHRVCNGYIIHSNPFHTIFN